MKFFVFCLVLSLFFSFNKFKKNRQSNVFSQKTQITTNDVLFLKNQINSKIKWQKWTTSTLKYTQKNNKLIFLFIGYSGCEPCQSMLNSTLNDSSVSDIINQKFVPILADKDYDSVVSKSYLDAQTVIQKMGRWPVTVILNPDLEPIFATSAIPTNNLVYALNELHHAWNDNNNELVTRGEKLTEFLNTKEDTSISIIDFDLKHKDAFDGIKKQIDPLRSGYQMPFKFPMNLESKYLLRFAYMYQNKDALEIVNSYVEKLLYPKIFDKKEGGFFRYCTDSNCQKVQREKIAADQALAIDFLAELFMLNKNSYAKEMIETSFKFINAKFFLKNRGIASNYDLGKNILDNQVLTTDNGLSIAAWSKAYIALGEKKYLDFASDLAHKISSQNKGLNNELYHSNNLGHLSDATSIDHGYLIYGLIELYQTNFNTKWLELAYNLQLKQIEKFWNTKYSYFQFVESKNKIPFSKVNYIDNLYPSENSLALDNLFRLSILTNNKEFLKIYEKLRSKLPDSFHDYPWLYTQAYASLNWKEKYKLKLTKCSEKSRISDFQPYTIFKCEGK